MNHACCGGSEGQAARRPAAAPRVAAWLALAAAPTFAAMALLVSILSAGPAGMICSAAHGSPLAGMGTMYLLMSAFHAGPWLRRIRERPTA